MKYLSSYKLFESNESKFTPGDMVYIDTSKVIGNFSPDKKYEIYLLSKITNSSCIKDDNNYLSPINNYYLYFNKIDTESIKDCFLSSFENLLNMNQCQYFDIKMDKISIHIRSHKLREYHISKEHLINHSKDLAHYSSGIEFEKIFNEEFEPRINKLGYDVSIVRTIDGLVLIISDNSEN